MIGLWMFQGWRNANIEKTKKIIRNVYLTKITKDTISGICQKEETWKLASPISEQVSTGIADLILKEDCVVKIVRKPDVIKEKVLRIDKDNIYLENYGKVGLDEDFRLFHISNSKEITIGKRDDLFVGYINAQYIVAGGKVCAALLGENKLHNIRVLLSKGANSHYNMEEVVVSATSDYVVTTNGISKTYPGSTRQTFRQKDVKNRIVIHTNGKGKIRLENLKRQYGIPEYRGTIEIERMDKYLHVINEVNLEEYLYCVVPSEMPTEYPMEALKSQAICARSYAVKQMKGKRLAKFGAHVDDSVSFQVYNNLNEDVKSIQAVKETANLVLSQNEKLITAYFYSVSGGISEGIKDVWFAKKDKTYLPVKWQGKENNEVDLSDENAFSEFMKKEGETYDVASPWYRWETSIAKGKIEKNITNKANIRYKVNPSQIQTKQKDGTYRSTGKVDVGEVKAIEIVNRGKGGVVRALKIVGSKQTIQVFTEYNIRYLLGDNTLIYKRKDKNEVTSLPMLPSGFFYLEEKEGGYLVHGAGYGHGVGMSQFGAKTMAEQGNSYQDILNFYFSGTNVIPLESLSKNG